MEFPQFKQVFHARGIDLLPHRSPFLFIDELISADETGALGTYTFTDEKNDFFKGHFPGHPVVPGVVLVETMAQVAGAALVATQTVKPGPDGSPPLFFLATVDEVKFRRPVVPGDTLTTIVENKVIKASVGKFQLRGYVEGELVSEAVVKCILGEKK
jgi:3-hydroxyacyl-[acyl-carrier-protein] dehydratase